MSRDETEFRCNNCGRRFWDTYQLRAIKPAGKDMEVVYVESENGCAHCGHRTTRIVPSPRRA